MKLALAIIVLWYILGMLWIFIAKQSQLMNNQIGAYELTCKGFNCRTVLNHKLPFLEVKVILTKLIYLVLRPWNT